MIWRFVARISNPGERFGKPFYEVDVPSPLCPDRTITQVTVDVPWNFHGEVSCRAGCRSSAGSAIENSSVVEFAGAWGLNINVNHRRSILSRRSEFSFDAREDLVQSVGRIEQHLDQRVERREMVVLEVQSVVVFPMLFGQLPRLDQLDVSFVELGAIDGEFGNSHGDE